MKVSVAALRKVLQEQLDKRKAAEGTRREQVLGERAKQLQDAVVKGELYVKRAKAMLAFAKLGRWDACDGRLQSPPTLYEESRGSGTASIEQALRLLALSSTDELTLADATRLVGKNVIECI